MKKETIKLTSPYLKLPELFYHKVDPTPLLKPFLISKNSELLKELGIDVNDEELVKLINGSSAFSGSEPYAMCYAGHQFGHFVPRLGDGRAINLGKTESGWNLQLKGSGLTRYSRNGDGRAVLRSSIREYLMSEAMFALGIPTTRVLGIIGSQTDVARQMWESGSVVMRLSPSWIRFGSFEYFYHSDNHAMLEQLAEFTIEESFSDLKDKEDRYYLMFERVVESTATLMAQWQAVGFNHGVMNTDNMSIAGLTIDYGPYSFLDDYNIDYICNHTDEQGRYRFGHQPHIGHWNLSMLAKALSPLVNIERLNKALESYGAIYTKNIHSLMSKKLGLKNIDSTTELLGELFQILQEQSLDYTLFFRELSSFNGDKEALLELCKSSESLDKWLDSYSFELKEQKSDFNKRSQQMKKTNPKFVLKNYILQEAIEKADSGDFTLVNDLLNIVHYPYDEHERFERYAKATPKSKKNLILSCSS
ncbi:MAG: YdiU family protein [Helicobacteraceae bacterium]|nr:YdiU family protein [Helicobacteraceae bacterium]